MPLASGGSAEEFTPYVLPVKFCPMTIVGAGAEEPGKHGQIVKKRQIAPKRRLCAVLRISFEHAKNAQA
jgi:hypothetical protein